MLDRTAPWYITTVLTSSAGTPGAEEILTVHVPGNGFTIRSPSTVPFSPLTWNVESPWVPDFGTVLPSGST